jgi:hypothetical protein
VAAIIFVPGCAALTWWQASRALGGNTLSWVYTFEWPIFAAYAVFMWWKLLHEPHPDNRARLGPADPETAEDASPPPDDELAAYNRYLADLNASGRQKRW